MKKRFTEEQIIGFLREAEAGMPVAELCRKHAFSEASYYLWRSKFGGMSVSYAKRLKELETENTRLKKLLAETMLENEIAKEARKGKDELWWYVYGDPVKHPLEMGSYFGRWCIEAVAAVKVFGLDDSLCLGHEHYPGALLRPDGPSTHPVRAEQKRGWLARLLGKDRGA